MHIVHHNRTMFSERITLWYNGRTEVTWISHVASVLFVFIHLADMFPVLYCLGIKNKLPKRNTIQKPDKDTIMTKNNHKSIDNQGVRNYY